MIWDAITLVWRYCGVTTSLSWGQHGCMPSHQHSTRLGCCRPSLNVSPEFMPRSRQPINQPSLSWIMHSSRSWSWGIKGPAFRQETKAEPLAHIIYWNHSFQATLQSLVVVAWATILIPYNSHVAKSSLNIMCSYGWTLPVNELQLHDLKIGYNDSSPSNRQWIDIVHCHQNAL